MAIDIKVDISRKLTTFIGAGELSFDEIIESINSFYNNAPTPDALVDLNNASLNTISSSQIRQIAELIQKMRDVQEGGKTAIVAETDLNFGLARMLEAMSTNPNQNLKVEMRVFRDIKEASSWLS